MIRRSYAVILRKNKKNSFSVVKRYCGKTVRTLHFEDLHGSRGAGMYAWLLAQDDHAKLIDLIDRQVRYY